MYRIYFYLNSTGQYSYMFDVKSEWSVQRYMDRYSYQYDIILCKTDNVPRILKGYT